MKIVTVVGARPQFIKASAVSRELRNHAGFRECLVHTGQHYDAAMSDVFFEQLAMPQPDYNLAVGSGTHGMQTARMLSQIEEILIKERPQCCLVYGDTNSTLAGALAAAKLSIPVAHVEAGLRSFNRTMPEEVNRVVTDHLSDICFCPSEIAVRHLAKEGIIRNVHLVGDVMFDAFEHNLRVAERTSDILDRLGLQRGGFMLATVHRAENTDRPENLASILKALMQLAKSGVRVVLPLHPRTKSRLHDSPDLGHKDLMVIDPVDYLDMLTLERHSAVILTDSGGVQKEAYWSRVPCVTLRRETEWTETVSAGWNVLVGPDTKHIVEAALSARPTTQVIADWEGHKASQEIVESLKSYLLLGTEAACKAA